MADDWRYGPALQAIREHLAALGTELHVAEMNLRQFTQHTDPPDEDRADQYLTEMARLHVAMAKAQRELVAERRRARTEAGAKGNRQCRLPATMTEGGG